MDLAPANELLTTTRSVRTRLDLTRPVAPELIEECLEIAVQAPTGSNLCRYQFMVVTDPTKRSALAELYRRAFAEFYPPERLAERSKTGPRDVVSWTSLAEHFQDVPVLIIACVEGRPEGLGPERLAALYGNILPAAWSLMLALRARGVGAAWTTIVFRYEKEVAELLRIPENMTPGALLPVAYFTGDDFRPAKRVPARERTHWNTWGVRR
ncbi:MAG: nitroreductase family protein [Candidatus Rokuibacteriota bacterium]